MPRMTNTYMLAGSRDPKEILASVRRGLTPSDSAAARSTSPGQVRLSGRRGYLIEDGKVGPAVKGAT